MISQEMKDRIIEELSETDLDPSAIIEYPVILLDNTGDPWVIDSRASVLFSVDEDNQWEAKEFSETTKEQEILYEDYTTVVYGIGEVEEPFMIKREDDPEFIEQCAMAFKMRNL